MEKIKKGISNPRMAYRYIADKIGIRPLSRRAGLLASSQGYIGTHVFQKDWDLLILLDTCRVDALQEVADDYDFLTDVGQLSSVGATSPEWIANTFTRDYSDVLRETGYVTCNAFGKILLENQGDIGEFSTSLPDYFWMGDWDYVRLAEVLGVRLEYPWASWR